MKCFPVLHEVMGLLFFLHTCEHCISQSTFTVLHTPFGERVLWLYTPPTPSSLYSMLVKIYRMHCVIFNCCFLFPFFFACVRLLEETWDAIVKNTGIDYSRCTT